MAIYEIAILGDVSSEYRLTLSNEIGRLVGEFDLSVGSDVVLHDGTSLEQRSAHSAFAAVYFGGDKTRDIEALESILRSKGPIIPTIGPNGDFGSDIPDLLQSWNGLRLRSDDPDMTELATSLLECLGLLREQRRAFVSYRRSESSAAAIQLHDQLSARGFDVFLDTHDIRPGEPFQDVLWHRLCDSDVLVMLDTPTYFDSKWTRQELGRARAKEIHVLRVIWPGHSPSRLMDLSETIYLNKDDFVGVGGRISSAACDRIVLASESIRSRSIASRHMSIAGRLRAEVEKIGAEVEGVGAHRAILVRLMDGKRIWAYPVVGVPTADLLNDVAKKAERVHQKGMPVLVYDHIGIRDQWIAHLKWLDDNIRVVRAVKVREADWVLSGWDE